MDNLKLKIDSAINKGITFLCEKQFSNGEFCCYMSNNDAMEVYDKPGPGGWRVADSVVFTTILIGNSLLYLEKNPAVGTILDKITSFLLNQKQQGSVWNHFTPKHSLYTLCPFDLDDTACASAFLTDRGVTFPDNKPLMQSNLTADGLFYTWFTLRLKNFNYSTSYLKLALQELKHPVHSFFFWKKVQCDRDDVDAVVNANVLYYLGQGGNSAAVITYLLAIIAQGKEETCDKWYRNVFIVYYFISRNFYKGIISAAAERQIIIDRVLKNTMSDGSIGESVLNTALAVCTLLNLNADRPELTGSVIFLLSKQAENGEWEKRSYYYDGPKKIVGWGSEELTTSICLEALARYKKGLLYEQKPIL